MRIIIDKNKSKIKSFNVTPTEDGFELKMTVKDDEVAQNAADVFSRVNFEFAEDIYEEKIKPKVELRPADEEIEKPNTRKQNQILEDDDIPVSRKKRPQYEIEDEEDIFPSEQRRRRSSYSNYTTTPSEETNLPPTRKYHVNDNQNQNQSQGLVRSILVVEDDPMINKAITNKLQKNGYNVTSAKDGEEAIEFLLDNLPDLIITDVMMPYTNGLEVIDFVRKNLRVNIPVIVLSSLEDEESILKSFKVGADDYISKPFGPDELLLRVKRLLLFSENLNKAILGKNNQNNY